MSPSDSETSKNLPNYDQLVRQLLNDHLEKQKAKNFAQFHKLLYELFDEKLQDNIFICWLARKLGIQPFILQTQCAHWKNNTFLETRGCKKLSNEIKQKVYNEWLENSIITIDRRNGRML